MTAERRRPDDGHGWHMVPGFPRRTGDIRPRQHAPWRDMTPGEWDRASAALRDTQAVNPMPISSELAPDSQPVIVDEAHVWLPGWEEPLRATLQSMTAARDASVVEADRLRAALDDVATWLEAEAEHPRPDPRMAMRMQAANLRAALRDDDDRRRLSQAPADTGCEACARGDTDAHGEHVRKGKVHLAAPADTGEGA